jgi:hypothetical protein
MNLSDICEFELSKRNLSDDKRYQKRLKWELEEIQAKEKESYFIDLYDRKVRYSYNQNNLLICWLLNIVSDFNIEKDPNCVFTGDLPDVDIDYIQEIRDYLKSEWAPKTFGEDYVCNIGNYTTFGLKSALIDMARVHGVPREEIQAITKELDAKDEEGKTLTWDSAVKLYPELKEYCEKYPDVAKAAQKLLNRNRGMGVHAGGLIISKSPLHDLVPLVKRKGMPQASSWVEGLHGQDLQPVGLIKFDLLVISNLLQIARCCDLIKKRHDIEGICNRPGDSDWTDVPAWRNNPVSLEMANEGDLKCVFQFDSEGMRKLVKEGGVDRFEDLVAYTALYRPGPLNCGMTARYVDRKRGKEKYSLHPLVKPILEKTYGVMTYQEQIMKILNVVGEIPLRDCEIVRKAISKKKVESFIKYKEMFIINGQKNLGCNSSDINDLWDQVESFSEYGFNASHAVAYTYISAWLLYLKSHYPHEFYASVLSCETLSEKIKEYKMEARIHGVETERIDVNKSQVTFDLIGDTIYYGLSNIKGVGEGPAKRIVAGQPYRSFEDFLTRFGTDASVLKPVIGLRCFKDKDPITLWKFAEHFKSCAKKIEDKKKRYSVSMEKLEKEFKELLPNETRCLADLECGVENPFDIGNWREVYDKDEQIEVEKEKICHKDDIGAKERIVVQKIETDEDGLHIQREVTKYYRKQKSKKTWNLWKDLRKIWQRRNTSIQRYKNIESEHLPKLLEFDHTQYNISDELLKEFRDQVGCEQKYYGFPWIHELERSPDYTGNKTFNDLKNSGSENGPVEMLIKKTQKAESKKGNEYYRVFAEDVTGHENKINVWSEDWQRWSEEFTAGNLLRVRLQPPSGGFPTFLMESNQKGKYRGTKRYEHKIDDIRVCVMQKGKIEEDCILSDEEALDQFSNCIME